MDAIATAPILRHLLFFVHLNTLYTSVALGRLLAPMIGGCTALQSLTTHAYQRGVPGVAMLDDALEYLHHPLQTLSLRGDEDIPHVLAFLRTHPVGQSIRVLDIFTLTMVSISAALVDALREFCVPRRIRLISMVEEEGQP